VADGLRVRVGDPAHLTLTSTHVRGRHVNAGTQEALLGEFDGDTPGDLLDFVVGVLAGVDLDATLGTTDGWAIYKGTKQPEASWELMKVLVGDDLQNLMIETWGGVPNRLSLVPSWKDKITSSFPVLEDANLDAVLEALKEGYPMLTEEFKNQGNTAYSAGNFNEAIKLYSKAIDFDSSNHVYFSNRSAAYACRWIAKSLVAAGLADRVLVQVSYSIGIAHPMSLFVNSYGTGKKSDAELLEIVKKNFDLRPGMIIRALNLRRPIYRKTAAFGHFGREDPDFEWEKPKALEF